MVRMIDAEGVRRAQQREPGTVVLDVLAAESFANRHIPGAVNADVHAPDFDQTAQALAPDKRSPVIVYCASEDCSASSKAAHRLESLAYRDVREFKAGLAGWKQAGHAFEGGTLRIQADAQRAPETAA